MTYNKYIDHTLLKPDASPKQIKKLCLEAKEYDFKSVCVNPVYVPLAVKLLEDTDVLVCTVIGFPLGQNLTKTKIAEAKLCVKLGAKEVDMVLNVGYLKARRYKFVTDEIRKIKAAVGKDIVLKVILETALLTKDEIIEACLLSREAGADFVKTSTGFAAAGATLENVRLMREIVGAYMGVKASGGVKNREQMLQMIEAGASRIGTSSGVEIMKSEVK
ncbi:MAG: deoxyribose-phosphate aldolase [Erysipelotrichaceae bacterium]|jgi:deoxyribose-phosphate aldolase|nr:deoxyribose-phosphate aldolase [Erysipelotrichaceae bacterium]